jgi:hypothetical protein
MINTFGTIIRVFWLMILLMGGWFLATAAVYSALTMVMGISFNWIHLWIIFALLIALRMFYPRNVFAW